MLLSSRAKTLVGHETKLVERIVAGVVAKHPEVRRVLELEGLRRPGPVGKERQRGSGEGSLNERTTIHTADRPNR
jgi:hypothetical protein